MAAPLGTLLWMLVLFPAGTCDGEFISSLLVFCRTPDFFFNLLFLPGNFWTWVFLKQPPGFRGTWLRSSQESGTT